MAGFDILALAVVGLATVFGLVKGFFHQLLKVAIVLSVFALLYFTMPNVSGFLSARVGLSPKDADYVTVPAAFVVIFIGLSVLVHLLRKPIGKVKFGGLDRLAGGALGFLKGVGFMFVLAFALISFPYQTARTDYFKPYLFKESWAAQRVVIAMGYVRPAFQQRFFVDAEEMMRKTNKPLEATDDEQQA